MSKNTKTDYRQELLSYALDYCANNGMKISTLGRLIMNDGKFFDRIQNGGGCTFDSYLRIKSWFAANKKPKQPTRRK